MRAGSPICCLTSCGAVNFRHRLAGREGCRRPRPVAHRPGVQARLRAATRHGRRSLLATDRLALGERALVARSDPPDGVMVDLYCASYAVPPAAVTLDIDDTVDVVHGHQQLSLFNAHYDERCFLPIHVYDTSTTPTGRRAFCAPARRPQGLRYAVTCAVLSVASAGIGHRPGSPFGATAITAARRSWSGATRTASASFLASPATPCSTGWSMMQPMIFAPADARSRKPCPARLRRGQATRAKLQKIEPPRLCTHRGYRQGSRHSLRRHQRRDRIGPGDLRDALLRPRPGREPDQIAQGSARLRPHQLPQSPRQPDAVDSAHRCLLAHAYHS